MTRIHMLDVININALCHGSLNFLSSQLGSSNIKKMFYGSRWLPLVWSRRLIGHANPMQHSGANPKNKKIQNLGARFAIL